MKESSVDEIPPGRRLHLDWWVVAILLAAGGVRIVYGLQYAASPYAGIQLVDQSYYRNWAMSIAGGDWLGQNVFEQGPLYAYLLACAFCLGMSDAVILAVQMMLGAATCVLIYACGRRLFDHPTARVAGMTAALFGPFVYYECMPMKSFLSPMLTILALYSAIRYADAMRVRWLICAGGAIGLACLNREVYGLLLVPAAIWAWSRPDFSNAGWRRRWMHQAILAGTCTLVILPATIRNWIVSGELVAVTSGGGEVFYMAHGPYATGNYEPPPFVHGNPYLEHEDFRKEAQNRAGRPLTRGESSRFWFREAWRHVAEEPLRAVRLTGVKAVNLFNDFEVPDSQNYAVTREFVPVLYVLPSFGWFVGIGFLGVVLALASPARFQLPLGFVAVYGVSILLAYNFGRFRIGLLPVWILFSAYGFCWLLRWGRAAAPLARWKWCTAAAGVGLLTLAAFRAPLGVSQDRLDVEMEKSRRTLAHMAELRKTSLQLTKNLSSDPQNAAMHSSLGQCYLELGRFHEAREHQLAAIRLDPGRAELHLSLGDTLARMGHHQQAIERYEQALDLRTDYAAAHARLGSLLMRLDRLDESKQHLRSVVSLEPASADARVNLGIVCARICLFPQQPPERRKVPAAAGFPIKTTIAAERRLRAEPPVRPPERRKVPAAAGLADKTERDAERRLRAEPPVRRSQRGDDCDEAVDEFREALRIEPGHPQAAFQLARLLNELGRVSELVDLLEESIGQQAAFPEMESLVENLLDRRQAQIPQPELARLAGVLDHLAGKAAASNDFDRAARLARKALGLAKAADRAELADAISARLKMYESQ